MVFILISVSVILLFGMNSARAEEQSDTVTISRSEFEALRKRLKELEAEMRKMRLIEKELQELKERFEKAVPSVESGEESLVIEPPRKFLGLFGEISETVPSLDLSGFVTVSYRHTNIEDRGRFTFDVVELNPRFNLFEELQIGMDMEFSEPTPDEDDFYVEQAFIRWVPYPDKPFEITMGRFNSILGIEHPDPSCHLLATTSLLTANFIPGDQTGAMIAWRRDNFRVFLAATNSFGYNDKENGFPQITTSTRLGRLVSNGDLRNRKHSASTLSQVPNETATIMITGMSLTLTTSSPVRTFTT